MAIAAKILLATVILALLSLLVMLWISSEAVGSKLLKTTVTGLVITFLGEPLMKKGLKVRI